MTEFDSPEFEDLLETLVVMGVFKEDEKGLIEYEGNKPCAKALMGIIHFLHTECPFTFRQMNLIGRAMLMTAVAIQEWGNSEEEDTE